MNNKFEFTLKAKENKSRRGIIKTSRVKINTTSFSYEFRLASIKSFITIAFISYFICGQ